MQSNVKELQKTNADLLMLLYSANFDKKRIVIAEHELSENFLTLYLEDKEDFKDNIDDTLLYKLPITKFAEIIRADRLNSCETIKHTESGRAYIAKIEIDEPIARFNNDATTYGRNEALDAALTFILNSVVEGSPNV